MGNMIRNIAVGGALAIVLGIILMGVIGTPSSAQKNSITGNTIQEKGASLTNGEVQTVRLTFKNYEYQLEPSVLVRGVPVKMEVDLDSVYGCMRDVVIPSANIRKYVREGDNMIEFTPEEAGTFNIRCSMNMGRGTFTVVEPDGSSSTFVEQEAAAPAGGSCGAGAGVGGCGCGAV